MPKITDLQEWKEEQQPHATFDDSFLDLDTHTVTVAPIAMLQEFVKHNIKIEEGENNSVLRCIVHDWLLAQGFGIEPE